MSEVITGKIVDISPDYGIRVEAPYTNWERLALRRYEDVQIILKDARLLSSAQRDAIFATVHDIAEFVEGYAYKLTVRQKVLAELELQWLIDLTDDEEVRYWLTFNYCRLTEKPFFSLSWSSPDCLDMTTARDFLGWLLEYCIRHGVPTSGKLIDRAEDIGRYLYACLLYKRCAVCGKKSEAHHCSGSTVGMGRNRKKIIHEGLELMSLCRVHHTEAHMIPWNDFNSKYSVFGITANKEICNSWGLKHGCD